MPPRVSDAAAAEPDERGEEEEEEAELPQRRAATKQRPRRSAGDPGCCQVVECGVGLEGAPPYNRRYRICNDHYRASCTTVDGIPSRFCQVRAPSNAASQEDGAPCRAAGCLSVALGFAGGAAQARQAARPMPVGAWTRRWDTAPRRALRASCRHSPRAAQRACRQPGRARAGGATSAPRRSTKKRAQRPDTSAQ